MQSTESVTGNKESYMAHFGITDESWLRCEVCPSVGVTIYKLSEKETIDNLVALCPDCHRLFWRNRAFIVCIHRANLKIHDVRQRYIRQFVYHAEK